MTVEIFIVLLLMCVGLYLNYVNLYTFVDYNDEKVKHYVFTYWISWIIPLIPIMGIIVEIFWIFAQCLYGNKSKAKILQKH